MDLPVIAGAISTTIFAVSALPMLLKAVRTKDLSSYSLGNIALANLGNIIHSVYVLHLPMGPVWFLHGYYLVTTALMLLWCLWYSAPRASAGQLRLGRRSWRRWRTLGSFPRVVAEVGSGAAARSASG
ncbi:MAG: hypothetical protein ACRDO1_13130 [Nocardioidaceae bacterium]